MLFRSRSDVDIKLSSYALPLVATSRVCLLRTFKQFASAKGTPPFVDQLFSPYFALRCYCGQMCQDPADLHLFAIICERLGQTDLAIELLTQAIGILKVAKTRQKTRRQRGDLPSPTLTWDGFDLEWRTMGARRRLSRSFLASLQELMASQELQIRACLRYELERVSAELKGEGPRCHPTGADTVGDWKRRGTGSCQRSTSDLVSLISIISLLETLIIANCQQHWGGLFSVPLGRCHAVPSL